MFMGVDQTNAILRANLYDFLTRFCGFARLQRFCWRVPNFNRHLQGQQLGGSPRCNGYYFSGLAHILSPGGFWQPHQGGTDILKDVSYRRCCLRPFGDRLCHGDLSGTLLGCDADVVENLIDRYTSALAAHEAHQAVTVLAKRESFDYA